MVVLRTVVAIALSVAGVAGPAPRMGSTSFEATAPEWVLPSLTG